jgi:hypothetical protein
MNQMSSNISLKFKESMIWKVLGFIAFVYLDIFRYHMCLVVIISINLHVSYGVSACVQVF